MRIYFAGPRSVERFGPTKLPSYAWDVNLARPILTEERSFLFSFFLPFTTFRFPGEIS